MVNQILFARHSRSSRTVTVAHRMPRTSTGESARAHVRARLQREHGVPKCTHHTFCVRIHRPIVFSTRRPSMSNHGPESTGSMTRSPASAAPLDRRQQPAKISRKKRSRPLRIAASAGRPGGAAATGRTSGAGRFDVTAARHDAEVRDDEEAVAVPASRRPLCRARSSLASRSPCPRSRARRRGPPRTSPGASAPFSASRESSSEGFSSLMQCRLLQPTFAATRSAVARRHNAFNSRSRARPFSQPKISDMLSPTDKMTRPRHSARRQPRCRPKRLALPSLMWIASGLFHAPRPRASNARHPRARGATGA